MISNDAKLGSWVTLHILMGMKDHSDYIEFLRVEDVVSCLSKEFKVEVYAPMGGNDYVVRLDKR